MKRVAALWLPNWSIDRILRAEPALAPWPEQAMAEPDLTDLRTVARAEKVLQCDAPRNSGWRPGARWAREEIARQVAELPRHQRPSMRLLGRSSEAAAAPFQPVTQRRSNSNDPHASPPNIAIALSAGDTAPRAGGTDGVALVTAHKVAARIEVAAASPAASALGIGSGMALTQARALVPHLVVRDADPEGDAADLHRLALLLAARWMPTVMPSDADGLFLDLTGVAHLHGGERRMAERLVRLLSRRTVAARIGVADTAGAAWALARYSGQAVTVCPPGDHAEALAPLPAQALRLPDLTLALLKRLGIATIGDVAALPRAPFARRFGVGAARRLDQALGHAAEPFDPVIPPPSIHVAQDFAEPIATAEAIEHWLGELVPCLTEALARAGQGARVLLLVAERVDGRPQCIRVGFARPNRDPAHILRLLRRRIEAIDPGYGIDALRLHVRRAEPLAPQPCDERLEERPPDLGPLIDMLANRALRVWRDMPVESDVPERSVARRAPLDPSKQRASSWRDDDVRQLDARAPDHPWHPSRPRPARLLHRPERLDHVLAELPDQPPRRFTWRGSVHVVVCADGPERITGEWWKRGSEREAVRDYFRVEVEDGRRFWLFRRGDGERGETGDLSWYLHGRFG
jgi:protein ImuB